MSDDIENIYVVRQRQKQLHEAYRVAARQLIADKLDATVPAYGGVHQTQDGAFVEVSLWVPRDVAEKMVP